MRHLTIAIAVGALLLLLCSNWPLFNKMRAAQIIDDAATPIQYTTLENYFVRNDVDGPATAPHHRQQGRI